MFPLALELSEERVPLALELSVALGSGEKNVHPDPHRLRGGRHEQVVLQGQGDKANLN